MKYKLPEGWEKVKLEDIAEVSSSKRIFAKEYVETGISFYRSKEIIEKARGKEIKETLYISTERYNQISEQFGSPKMGDILLASIGANLGVTHYVDSNEKFYFKDGNVTWFKNFIEITNSKYLYYYFISKRTQSNLKNIAIGSAQKALTITGLKNLDIILPTLKEQEAIAETLSSLDNKIKTNNKTNKNLEQQAQELFKHWFVDFEFPDKNGDPYKSSGGQMVESNLGMIPEGWEVKKLDKIIDLHDAKRIPLSKKERDSMPNEYPYYGATSIIDYVENYIFDGTYLLLGEDGSVSDELGYPILQYVWGKIWVNNHAHVITGKVNITVEYLYMLLKNTNINSIITGAVQKKINQGNLKSLDIINPDKETMNNYMQLIDSTFKERKLIETQNQNLSQLRDILIPKLMSGELRIPLD